MPGPCRLDSVQLLCGSDVYNHGIYLNARVYACHTTVTELDSVYEDNYAGHSPKAALTLDTLFLRWQNGAWQGLGFDTPFDYDGSDNLILEFRWQGDNDSAVYDRGWYTEGNRAVDAKSSTAERGTPRNYMPRLRIFYTQTGITEGSVEVPARGLRVWATPNPFATGTAIHLQSAVGGRSRVRIFDAEGRLVRTLLQSTIGNRQSPVVSWDGRDGAGRQVAPGAYFCRIGAGSSTGTIQLIRHN